MIGRPNRSGMTAESLLNAVGVEAGHRIGRDDGSPEGKLDP